MRSFSRRTGPVAILSILLLFGCASADEQEGIDWDVGPQRTDYASLVVENDNTATVTIYALRSGNRQRIGTITGLRTERFDIRRSMLSGGGELRVAVSLLGSPHMYGSQPIYVDQGDVISIAISSLIR